MARFSLDFNGKTFFIRVNNQIITTAPNQKEALKILDKIVTDYNSQKFLNRHEHVRYQNSLLNPLGKVNTNMSSSLTRRDREIEEGKLIPTENGDRRSPLNLLNLNSQRG